MNTYRFKIYGHEYVTKVVRREDTEIVISINGQEYKAYIEPKKKAVLAKPTPKLVRETPIHGEGTRVSAKPSDVRGVGCVKAPLPGMVVKIPVKQGDTVKAGDTVIIMEAMKMQNQIASTTSGKVMEIMVSEGDPVVEGQEMVRIDS